MKRIIGLTIVLTVGSLFPTACAGPTDQEKVLSFIKTLTRLAEENNLAGILDLLDEGYADFEGRSRAGTEAMLGEYFTRYRGITVNILRSEVEELSAGEAVVRADLALSSGTIKAIRKLAKVSLDNYRLRIRLRKSGTDWLVTYAEWRPLDVAELLSGSG